MKSRALAVAGCCAPVAAATTSIRRAAAGDLDAALALLEAAALPVEGVGDFFATAYSVAEQAGRVVGVAGVEVYGEHGLLRSVAVDERVRGQRIGEALVRDRLAWAREQGLGDVFLLTTTAPDFFTRFGFERVARGEAPAALQQAPEFAVLCAESAVAMRVSVGAGDDVRAHVRERYARAAQAAAAGDDCSCCGGRKTQSWNPVTSDLYDVGQTADVPAEALLASLGCGNPTALAELRPGETVLDLGSGGGIDVLLSAKRVGPAGKAYGLDMTDEMLALARANQVKAGATNVEFLKGEIENIPLPDDSVDVIISNCVINLAADKAKVIDEAFRVLRPGGRFAVSDIVVRGAVPASIRQNAELWTGCIAGALEETEYARLLRGAGFEEPSIEPTRIYSREDIVGLAAEAGLAADAVATQAAGHFMSAFVRARKPKPNA